MRSKYSARIFLAGLLIAAFLSIPIVNLLTPALRRRADGAPAQAAVARGRGVCAADAKGGLNSQVCSG